jgi:hypothetical protein
MASEKAIYWMAVGLVALVGGNHFAQKLDSGALAQRAMAAVERISGESGHYFAVATGASSRCARSEAVIARVQTRLASVQTMMARRQAACTRIEAAQARLTAMQQMHTAVAMPNLRMIPEVAIPQIVIPQIVLPQINLPQVRVNPGGDI